MSQFSFSTTIDQKRTDHLSLVNVWSISPTEASNVHPSPSFASCPLGDILTFSFLHKARVTKDVVAPLSIVIFTGSEPENTVKTCELTGIILLSWQQLLSQLQYALETQFSRKFASLLLKETFWVSFRSVSQSWSVSLSGHSSGSVCISHIMTLRSSTSFLVQRLQVETLWLL